MFYVNFDPANDGKVSSFSEDTTNADDSQHTCPEGHETLTFDDKPEDFTTPNGMVAMKVVNGELVSLKPKEIGKPRANPKNAAASA